MYKTTTQLIAVAWLAILAILFNALMPAVSHAISVSPATPAQVEVCTAMGMEMMTMPVLPNGENGVPSDKLLKSMTHCAYCATHAGAFGLAPAATGVFAVLGGHDDFPPLYYQAARTLFPWLLAQSRAPPFLA
jgi:hypothetical protein